MKAIKGLYRQIFLAVDFKKNLIRFKSKREDEQFETVKDIAFQDLIEIKRLEIDIYKGEQMTGVGPPFKFKFLLRSLNSQLFLFASSEMERDVWIESMIKGKDINQSEVINYSRKQSHNQSHQRR